MKPDAKKSGTPSLKPVGPPGSARSRYESEWWAEEAEDVALFSLSPPPSWRRRPRRAASSSCAGSTAPRGRGAASAPARGSAGRAPSSARHCPLAEPRAQTSGLRPPARLRRERPHPAGAAAVGELRLGRLREALRRAPAAHRARRAALQVGRHRSGPRAVSSFGLWRKSCGLRGVAATGTADALDGSPPARRARRRRQGPPDARLMASLADILSAPRSSTSGRAARRARGRPREEVVDLVEQLDIST